VVFDYICDCAGVQTKSNLPCFSKNEVIGYKQQCRRYFEYLLPLTRSYTKL